MVISHWEPFLGLDMALTALLSNGGLGVAMKLERGDELERGSTPHV